MLATTASTDHGAFTDPIRGTGALIGQYIPASRVAHARFHVTAGHVVQLTKSTIGVIFFVGSHSEPPQFLRFAILTLDDE